MGRRVVEDALSAQERPEPTLAEAEEQLSRAKENLRQVEDDMYGAFDEAKEAYDRLKHTKGTENLQHLEELVEETLGQKGPNALVMETALARGEAGLEHGAVHLALEGIVELAKEELGKEAAKFFSFLGAAYYAWEIGYEGAKAATLVVRNFETQIKTWAGLFPQRIRYELALKEVEQAQALVDSLQGT